jgi:hypothetical protein
VSSIDATGAAPSKAPRQRTGEYVLDAWNDIWLVQQTRQTDYDFVIYLGRPREMTGPMGAEVIITPDLASHFERCRRNPGKMGLPLGETVIKRIRGVLGHHRYQDAEIWWLDRLTDLREMTGADFCARHRVSLSAVIQARQHYGLAHHLRDKHWWKEPKMRDLLMSKMPSAWIAQQVGLAAVTVRKYRSELASAGDNDTMRPAL